MDLDEIDQAIAGAQARFDHPHVPVAPPRCGIDGPAARYADKMRAAGLDVTVTQIAPGQVRVSGREPGTGQQT